MQASPSFKDLVKQYVQLNDEVTTAAKSLAESRKRLKEMEAAVITYMTNNNIEQCNLKDGCLVLKQNKTQAPLNKDLLVETMQDELGPQKAEDLLAKVNERREASSNTRSSLKRTKNRGAMPTAPEAPEGPAEA